MYAIIFIADKAADAFEPCDNNIVVKICGRVRAVEKVKIETHSGYLHGNSLRGFYLGDFDKKPRKTFDNRYEKKGNNKLTINNYCSNTI